MLCMNFDEFKITSYYYGVPVWFPTLLKDGNISLSSCMTSPGVSVTARYGAGIHGLPSKQMKMTLCL